MRKDKDSLLIVSIAILLCVFRITVNDSQYLNEIMALINLVALNYSLWCMFNEAESKLDEKFDRNTLGKEALKNKRKGLERCRRFVEIIIFLICGIVYFLYMKSTIGNDILTIIALCFALEANNFSEKIARYYYKKRK